MAFLASDNKSQFLPLGFWQFRGLLNDCGMVMVQQPTGELVFDQLPILHGEFCASTLPPFRHAAVTNQLAAVE
jgi:hypothetical protein